LAPCMVSAKENVVVSDLSVSGKIEGENIVFDLTFVADVLERGTMIPLVAGDVAHMGSDFPKKSELIRKGEVLLLKTRSKGKQDIKFKFASRAKKDDIWREATFSIPASSIRKLSVVCDRDDLEIVFPGALNVVKGKTKAGLMEVTAFLGLSSKFVVRWKPTVKKLSGELAVACDASTIASASVGALKIDNMFTYRIVQGELKELSLQLPEALNVTGVKGDDIQDWVVDGKGKDRLLKVTLSRPKDVDYIVRVESEMILPDFPCEMNLPVIVPQNVIRSSGFLMFGTDSAIKLMVKKALGLTQIDQTAFPGMKKGTSRRLPSRSKFAYQYANLPYTLTLSADDIVPEYSSNERIVLSVKDNDAVLQGSIELDVRDAPCREIVIETSPEWIVANVAGRAISDYDIRDEKGQRLIRVYFRDAVIGRTLINLRLERSMKDDITEFKAPEFLVRGTRTARGYLVLAAEKGLQVKEKEMSGLRKVQTGSVETRVPGAQLAYRFKEAGWSLSLLLERTKPTIYSEAFHLVSIGEGVLYCSSALTYHIEGAPVRSFRIVIPAAFRNVEFSGLDVRGWDHEGEIWTVSLQDKVIGDYTLGVTYDKQFAYKKDELVVGGVETLGTTRESGYIALASSASLNLTLQKKDESVMEIDRNEVPEAYAMLVENPILQSYKYVKAPHIARVKLERYETEKLLEQVADHTTLSTDISKDGEIITTITYAIKNLSLQYLVVSLPEGAKLWTATLIEENQARRDVACLKEDGKTLIPVSRLKNPNLPVRVEIKYAQKEGKIGAFGKGMKIVAPGIAEAHSTFAKWTFRAPKHFAIAGAKGNMTAESSSWASGILLAVINMFKLIGIAFTYYLAWTILAILIVGSLCILSYSRGRARGFVWKVIVLSVVLLIVLGIASGAQSLIGRHGRHAVQSVFHEGGAESNVISLTKTVSLAQKEPLQVKLTIVPRWVGRNSSLVLSALLLVLGVGLVSQSKRPAGRNVTVCCLGFTVLVMGVTQVSVGRNLVSSILPLLALIYVVSRLLKGCYAKGCERRLAAPPPIPVPVVEASFVDMKDDVPFEPIDEDDNPKSGRAMLSLLAMVMMASMAVSSVTAKAPVRPKPPIVPSMPVMQSVLLSIEAPKIDDESEKSARITAVLEFELDEPGEFMLLRSPAVLTEYDLDSRDLKIKADRDGYRLVATDDGKYKITLKYSMPTVERTGAWFLGLEIPRNLRNEITFHIPEKELEIESPDAVLLKVAEKGEDTTAIIVYGSAIKANIAWRARARKTKLEKVVFFCEINTLAVFKPGVVDLTNLIRYQIAQGELKSMLLKVPEGMSVTAVRAERLSTWRFDPETRLLEAVLERPVSGDFNLEIVSQVSCEGLPYSAAIGTLEVKDAMRQRGSMAMAVPDTVQIRVEKTDGLNPMNIEDVSPVALAAAHKTSSVRRDLEIKRAFRYHSLPASATVNAERVLPELRVAETASLSVADERVILSTQLRVNIIKAGIFSMHLKVPQGFDVETVTGQDISHWEEVAADDKAKKAGESGEVIVHFKKQAMGEKIINVVMAKTQKELNQSITVPRVEVVDAVKHTGTLIVSGERGVRMTTVDREGVSEINPRELGVKERGVLAFKLLRPDWLITLKADVLSSTIRSEVLQRIDISEGVLQCTAFVRYRIDHAGCKVFRLQAPVPEARLAVTGKDVAKVTEIDTAKGIWEVELHNKEDSRVSMEVRYEVEFDNTKGKVQVASLQTLDVESQKGYLVLMSGGRIQVRPVGDTPGLKYEDARSIPATFNAGDLSEAVLCYRTISGEYTLDLSVIRHKSAEVLPATIDNVRLMSVVTEGGQVLTRVSLNMVVGELSTLEMELPGRGASMWTAFVNGKASDVSQDGNKYRLSLGEPVPGETTKVEFVYASSATTKLLSRKQKFRGPQFDLPLNNIEWTFYVVPGRRYHGFGGTMDYQEPKEPEQVAWFDVGSYNNNNLRLMALNRRKAKSDMAQSEEFVKRGWQKQAKKALQNAVNYSQNDMAFNEDARIQYKNLAEQQAVVGLVQRRDKMRSGRNIQDVGQLQRLQGFHKGNFTEDYAEQVQESLSDRENTSLMQLAEKIMAQQEAAETPSQAIQITMPEHGQQLKFFRLMQIEEKADMSVVFGTSEWKLAKTLLTLLSAVAVFGAFCFLMRKREAKA
jgi:hypothetical protein